MIEKIGVGLVKFSCFYDGFVWERIMAREVKNVGG